MVMSYNNNERISFRSANDGNDIMKLLYHRIWRFAALALAALAWIAGSYAIGQAAQLRIVVVQGSDIKPFAEALEGFESACSCEIIEVIVADSEHSDVAARVRRLRPDGVLALGIDALTQLRSIKDIPVFYTMTAGARHPFGEIENFSGVNMFVTPEKQIDAIRELLPGAKRVGIIYNPRNSASLVEKAARQAKLDSMEIVSRQAGSAREVPAILDDLRGKIDVLFMIPDMTVTTPETVDAMLLFSFRNRVPIFTFSVQYVEKGALAALSVSAVDLGAQTGETARKVIKEGIKGGIRTYARKQVLTVNARIANKLGIAITEEVLKKSMVIK